MRKYTSKKMKVEMYSKKYNLPEDYVRYILTENECMLTFDELKIKYDCPTLGKMPDWFSEEELDKIIWKSIHETYDARFSYWTTKEELYSTMQEFIRKKFHLFETPAHIKVAIKNRLIWLLREHLGRSSYIEVELDKPITVKNEADDTLTYYNMIHKELEDEQNIKLKDNIMSVRDKQIRELLIVTGYLLCDLSYLEKEFNDIINNCSQITKINLLKLQQVVENNKQIEFERNCNTVTKKQKRKRLTINNVVQAMGITGDRFKDIKQTLLNYDLI